MAFKFKIRRNPVIANLPSRPTLRETEQESLTGSVGDKTASAPEERLARAFDRKGIQYEFRHVVGAPKGLPGWKEVDFVVLTKGMVYLVEVDTAFTHRDKGQSDILHDAILLNDPEMQAYGQLWPRVLHVDGDTDLADEKAGIRYVERTFGK